MSYVNEVDMVEVEVMLHLKETGAFFTSFKLFVCISPRDNCAVKAARRELMNYIFHHNMVTVDDGCTTLVLQRQLLTHNVLENDFDDLYVGPSQSWYRGYHNNDNNRSFCHTEILAATDFLYIDDFEITVKRIWL